MVIARKLLIPTLALAAFLLLMLIGYFTLTNIQTLQATEADSFKAYSNTLDQELEGIEKLAIGQAKQTASNPAIQAAIADRNRQLLFEQASDAYSALRGFYDIRQLQFIDPSSKVLLRMQEPEVFGDDISGKRMSVLVANTVQREVSGLEIAEDGLSVRAVAPILYQGVFQGCVDYALHIDKATLSRLKSKTGVDWQMMLLRQSVAIAGFKGEPGAQAGPIDALILQATTLDKPFYAPGDGYSQVLRGQVLHNNLQYNQRSYIVHSIPLRDLSGQVVGVIDIVVDRTQALALLYNRIWLAVFATLVGLGVIWALLAFIIRRTLNPIQELTETTNAIAQGELQRTAKVRSPRGGDEVDQLARSFNTMTQQLRQTLSRLEQRVAERTRDLERRSAQLTAASEVARDVTGATDLNELLNRAVQIIRQRFDFYHAGVFMIDESGEYAVLRAATGEAGRVMIESGHKLRVGQVGLVGAASGTGRPQVVLDVTESALHYKNPLLPETRSETAIPLRVTEPQYGERVIGVLDVQSRQADAFSPEDITILQTLADQLAIAITNAQLIEQLNRTVRELEQASGQFTQRSWRDFSKQTQAPGYRYLKKSEHEKVLQPLTGQPEVALHSVALQALQSGQTISINNKAAAQERASSPSDGTTTLAVPLRLRGQVIGVLDLHFAGQSISPEVSELAEEIASRLSLVLESTRLLYEAQRLAYREQEINWIATQVRSSIDLEAILQNTVRELGKALGAKRTYIQIGDVSAGSQEEAKSLAEPNEDPGATEDDYAEASEGELPETGEGEQPEPVEGGHGLT